MSWTLPAESTPFEPDRLQGESHEQMLARLRSAFQSEHKIPGTETTSQDALRQRAEQAVAALGGQHPNVLSSGQLLTHIGGIPDQPVPPSDFTASFMDSSEGDRSTLATYSETA